MYVNYIGFKGRKVSESLEVTHHMQETIQPMQKNVKVDINKPLQLKALQ